MHFTFIIFRTFIIIYTFLTNSMCKLHNYFYLNISIFFIYIISLILLIFLMINSIDSYQTGLVLMGPQELK